MTYSFSFGGSHLSLLLGYRLGFPFNQVSISIDPLKYIQADTQTYICTHVSSSTKMLLTSEQPPSQTPSANHLSRQTPLTPLAEDITPYQHRFLLPNLTSLSKLHCWGTSSIVQTVPATEVF